MTTQRFAPWTSRIESHGLYLYRGGPGRRSLLVPGIGGFLLDSAMSGREEFDHARMRREEAAYFSVKKKTVIHPLDSFLKQLPAIKALAISRQPTPEETAEVQRLRSMPYDQYLETDHWLRMRQQRIDHDKGKCSNCGSKQNLTVHHKSYARRGDERLEDLETLCWGCHMAKHPEKR